MSIINSKIRPVMIRIH